MAMGDMDRLDVDPEEQNASRQMRVMRRCVEEVLRKNPQLDEMDAHAVCRARLEGLEDEGEGEEAVMD